MLDYPWNEQVCAQYLENSRQEIWIERCSKERSVPKKVPMEYLFCPELMKEGIDGGIVCQRESRKLSYLDEASHYRYEDYNVKIIFLHSFHIKKYNRSVSIFQSKIVIGVHLFLDL